MQWKTTVRVLIGIAILTPVLASADMRGQPVCGVRADEAAIITVELASRKWLAWKPTARDLNYFDSEEASIGGWDAEYVCDVEIDLGQFPGNDVRQARFHRLGRDLIKPSPTDIWEVVAPEFDVRKIVVGEAAVPAAVASEGVCGLPDDARVIVTSYHQSTSYAPLRARLEENGRWEAYWGSYSAKAHSEAGARTLIDRHLGGKAILPESPHCVVSGVTRFGGALRVRNVHDLRIYPVRIDDPHGVWTTTMKQVSQQWLESDQFWEVENYGTVELTGDPAGGLPPVRRSTNTGGQRQADDDGLTGLIGAFVPRKRDASPPPPATYEATGDRNHYLAVATSPPAGQRIGPDETGYSGFGWHTNSGHEAGMAAVAECRQQGGGSVCSSNSSGTSMRGGCVGLAMATWRDRDEDPERTYVVTSSSFRNLISRDLRAGCDRETFGGKYHDTVVEHSCDIVRIVCAGEVVPPTPTTAQ